MVMGELNNKFRMIALEYACIAPISMH